MVQVGTGDTPWNHFPLHGLSRVHVVPKAVAVVQELGKLGVALPPGSRLDRAISLIKRVNAAPDTLHDNHTAALSCEAFRTVYELLVIAWSLDTYVGGIDSITLDRLRCFGRGADLPSLDTNTTARDTQFELLTAAHLLLGGADLRVEEPDYTLLYHGRRIGVAVKRLTSLKPGRVEAVLSDAEKQIKNSTGQGLVALSLDSWLGEATPDTPEEAGPMFNECIQRAQQKIYEASRRTSLLGTLAFGSWTSWDTNATPPKLRWKMVQQRVGSGRTDPQEISQFGAYFDVFDPKWRAGMSELASALRAPQGACS